MIERDWMSKSILLVDDEESILYVLSLVLQRQGYDVGVAKSGREAIEKLVKKFYNMAIIDFHLPDISGVDLVRVLNTTSPQTKKIILTGDLQTVNEIVADGERIDFLTKPLSAEDLLNVVREKLDH